MSSSRMSVMFLMSEEHETFPQQSKPRAQPRSCTTLSEFKEAQPPAKRAKRCSEAELLPNPNGKPDLHAQMMRYGPKLFMKDCNGKYACFFENCAQKMTNNFSRHVFGVCFICVRLILTCFQHEQRGDKVKSFVKSSGVTKELCFIDQTPSLASPPRSPHSPSGFYLNFTSLYSHFFSHG